MATARQILDQLSAALVATGAGLRPSAHRFALEDERAGPDHRHFEMTFVGARNQRGVFGGTVTTLTAEVLVKVSYARLGGDAGGGDRKSVNALAGDDGVLIADCLKDSRNWAPDTTGIIEIRPLMAAGRFADGKLSETWASRFRLEHEVPWPS